MHHSATENSIVIVIPILSTYKGEGAQDSDTTNKSLYTEL